MKSYEVQFIRTKNRMLRSGMHPHVVRKIIKKDAQKGIIPKEFLLCLENPPVHAVSSKSNPNRSQKLSSRPDGKTKKNGARLAHYCKRDYETSPCQYCKTA